MDVTPIKRYSRPAFPTRRIIDEHPDLLRLVPKRWQSNPAVLTALTALVAIACGSRVLADENKPQAGVTRVAPVFQHGDGRGSYGCSAVTAPVFLSESDARHMLTEEGKLDGLYFAAPGPTVKNVLKWDFSTCDPRGKNKPDVEPLQLDGVDAKHNIVFEFVSVKDVQAWQPWPDGPIESWNTRAQAMGLRDTLARAKPSYTIGVFYDPLADFEAIMIKDAEGKMDWKATSQAYEAKVRKASTELLRAQVRDFIKWLKAQGVI